MSHFEHFINLASTHNGPDGVTFAYGTAGFRMKSELLDPVMFRVGIIAGLRSRFLNGKTIGVMVTASHNPAQDNGVKVVDPKGEMLEQSWEAHTTKLANIHTAEELLKAVESLSAELGIDNTAQGHVIIGQDTRPSGPKLVESLIHGLTAINVKYTDYDIKTTPQLHYIVRCLNTAGTPEAYGEPTEEGYYAKLSKAFKTLVQGKQRLSTLTVDCANGVGAPKLKLLAEAIGEEYFSVTLSNDDITSPEKLNYQSGADYVKVNHKFPHGVTANASSRYCALDGDADRLVYFYADPSTLHLKLLDGDKIAALSALLITDLIRKAGIPDLSVGVVQTAYANGASTYYLKEVLKAPTSCVKTGVKHLHHEAEKYDIGVYFEANGHGTVTFSEKALQLIQGPEAQANYTTPAQIEAGQSLSAVVDLINQTVGDALSDMLLVEVILAHRGWDLPTWDTIYTDLPNRLAKLTVADRAIFTTTDAERKLVTPVGLQDKIDALVKKYTQGRSFVRPSGTEDVVRIYAEAATRKECDDLALAVADLVYREAGGVGEPLKGF